MVHGRFAPYLMVSWCVGRYLAYKLTSWLGHAGHETVDYATENLPDLLKRKLTATLEKDPTPTSEVIGDVLRAGILSFDDGIGQALLDIFPSPGAVKAMSDEEIRKIVNDDGPNNEIVLRCMRGTTVLVALVDPTKSDVWVASLGDCMASTRQFFMLILRHWISIVLLSPWNKK